MHKAEHNSRLFLRVFNNSPPFCVGAPSVSFDFIGDGILSLFGVQIIPFQSFGLAVTANCLKHLQLRHVPLCLDTEENRLTFLLKDSHVTTGSVHF